MAFTGTFRLKGITFKQDEGGPNQRYVVTFETYASGSVAAEVAIAVPLAEVSQRDLVKKAEMMCHDLLNNLADHTRQWKTPS